MHQHGPATSPLLPPEQRRNGRKGKLTTPKPLLHLAITIDLIDRPVVTFCHLVIVLPHPLVGGLWRWAGIMDRGAAATGGGPLAGLRRALLGFGRRGRGRGRLVFPGAGDGAFGSGGFRARVFQICFWVGLIGFRVT